MDSWNYGSQDKGFMLSGDMVSNTSTTLVMGWDLKTPFDYDNNTRLDSSRCASGNLGFMELGFPQITTKPLNHNSYGGFLDGGVNNLKEFSQEDSSSKFSSLSQDSPFIDLKLGSLGDYQDEQIGISSKEMLSVVCSVPEKRAHMAGLNYQPPLCQVHGCNVDLSNSKDYHKRNKVCDVHSKTAKVIVNGIEKRFCQQCSRFHLLAEFDDGKRSCRKRLVEHNERRRKPHLDNRSVKNGKMHLPYNGSRLLGTSLPMRTSFISSNIFPSGIMYPMKYETTNLCTQVKREQDEFYCPRQMMPGNEHLLQKSSLPFFGLEKQNHFMQGNCMHTARSSFFETNNQRPNNSLDADSVPQFLLQTASSNRDKSTGYDSASSIQGVSGASDSSSALSHLSSQSRNSSSHSSGIPLGQPLFGQGNHDNYNFDQFSEKLFGLSSQASTSLVSGSFSSSLEFDRLEPIMVSDASNSADFGVQTDGLFQDSELVSAEDPRSHENATTVDLLQLSLQLQCVEHQRHSMQVKQGNDSFCCLPII